MLKADLKPKTKEKSSQKLLDQDQKEENTKKKEERLDRFLLQGEPPNKLTPNSSLPSHFFGLRTLILRTGL
jgi:hypothetical protein